ncbi:cytochrome b5 domain-containing protein 1 isoform X2 [Lethenteron reissneri]|uniref:cytochrome b5 domain-containing protein 1 isoform X2 n=1 Tax=Lethenteron reissneri TaxID=7753 RepID=UPI002AB66E2D|nr:cytochrome b5 domain-containing protein 1 isoform X2 [Lethenteron reissneri]
MRPRYLSPREVSLHNVPEDTWVSFLGAVYDLTPLCDQYKGDMLMKPIIEAAGQDISHWFDLKTKDIRTHVDPVTNTVTFHTPQGRFLHVPPPYPSTDWANDFGRPWWRDTSYQVGLLSKKTRFIRVINTLTSQEHIIEVCTEEIMSEILQRYLKYNAHAGSYTWKHAERELDMGLTLDENGVPDEDEEFLRLRLEPDDYRQTLHLYYNDDLTEA